MHDRANRPWLGTGTHQIRATASDPDREASLNLTVEWAAVDADGTYGAVLGSKSASVASGTSHPFDLPALADGTYAWRAKVSDGALANRADSGWCEFSLDVSRPGAQPVVSFPVYKDDGSHNGGAGVTAPSPSLRAASATSAGTCGLGESPPTTSADASALGGDVTKELTPPLAPTRPGQRTLCVRSVDRAGNLSDIRSYVFLLSSAPGPVGAWKLTETSGTTLADSSGKGRPATLSGGEPGRQGRVVGGDRTSCGGAPRRSSSWAAFETPSAYLHQDCFINSAHQSG